MVTYLLYMAMPAIVWVLFMPFTKYSVDENDSHKKKYLFVCGALMFFMLACRHYTVGSGDGAWYYNNWLLMSNSSFESLKIIVGDMDVESGYLIISWILSRVFKDPQFVFVFYGLLVSVSVCRFVYKNSEHVMMSLTMFNCLGLWGFMVQGIRQGIAMCICLFAVEYCKKKKFVPFLLVVLLATLFHASAIVFVAVYFFSSLHMNIRDYFITGALVVVGMLLMDYLWQYVNYFINDSYEIGITEDSSGGIVSTIIYILILALAMLFHKNEYDTDGNDMSVFFYMTLIGFIAFVMRYSYNTIAQRVSYYFLFGQMAVLPTITHRYLVEKQRGIINLAIILLCYGIALYKASYTLLIPYNFFWQVV